MFKWLVYISIEGKIILIGVIDYGVGNAGSIVNMLDFLGADASIARNSEDISKASHLILPGVGSFDAAMNRIRASNMIPVLEEMVFKKQIPILGICLGMQLFGRSSQEGSEKGLGWLDADTVKLNPGPELLKIPHIGWSDVFPRENAGLFQIKELSRFYFVHSYHIKCDDKNIIAAECKYGDIFTCAVQKDNIYGVQFHPEKSHKFGMEVFRRFIKGAL
jgi:glutamine amidotransferase